jgi:3-isopropylmalate/(R)-2-methylmalate dehydratase small subunit
MGTALNGKAYVYGDNIDTDRIIPGKYTKTLDTSKLAKHVLEDLDATFAERVQAGDVLVAGTNFGCGSSREQAPIAIKAAGVSAVIARSFARIFYRNAVNIGLPVIEVPDHAIEDGATVQIDLQTGAVGVGDAVYQGTKMPRVMIDILREGGLVNYLVKYGGYRESDE